MTNPHPVKRYKPLIYSDSMLCKRIMREYNRGGFVGATITGHRGAGKSMYAYKIMAQTYAKLFGLSDDDAYEQSLKHMLFGMEELVEIIIRNFKNEERSPVICLDDATVHFCSYKFFTNLKEVVVIHKLFDTIRTGAASVLLTCPNVRLLLNFLRQYKDYEIQIKMQSSNDWRRYARSYRKNYLPDGKKFNITIPFQDNYSCYVKDEYFEAYMKKRNKYLGDAAEEMAKTFKIAKKMGETKKKYYADLGIDEPS